MPEVLEIISCSRTGTTEENKLLEELDKRVEGQLNVYAVMDHAVALGLYRDGKIQIGLGLERRVAELPLAYVQELRVFNEKQEFRALRKGKEFLWRLRIDETPMPGGEKVLILREKHKLWGSVKEKEDTGEWSLLREKRGSALLFPGRVELHGEKGVLVRNYIALGKSGDRKELVYYVDERLCGFENWEEEGRQ